MITIAPGGLVTKPATGQRIYQVDWTLSIGSLGISSSSWAGPAIQPTTGTALTIDSTSIVGKKTYARISGGQTGCLYRITNTIHTNGSPSEIKLGDYLLRVE